VILFLGIAAIVVALVFGPRRLGVLAGGFAAFAFASLTWIYVLTLEEVEAFSPRTAIA
jgi:hypothetical protein